MKPRDSTPGITATSDTETACLRVESPIGRLTLTANTAGEIVSVVIEARATLTDGVSPDGVSPDDVNSALPDRVLPDGPRADDELADERPTDGEMAEPKTAALHAAAQQLSEYFTGTRTAFTVKLAAPAGTDFQRRVWQRIARIPYGEGATYGQIALDLGKPGAGRAVGSAVAANIQPLFVGCHRVLGVSGHVTGYSQGAGTPTKQWLLTHEGTPHRPGSQEQDQPRLLATTSSTTSSSSPAAP